LRRNELAQRFWLPLLVNDYAQPHEYSPVFVEPFDQKNQKPVLNHSSRRLVAEYRHLDSRVSSSGGITGWIEKSFFAPKLAVRTPGGKKLYRFFCEVLNPPFK
jgi:hypothetical protein